MYTIIKRNASQRSTAQYNSKPRNAEQVDTTHRSTTLEIQSTTAERNTTQSKVAPQRNPARRSAMQHNTAWCATTFVAVARYFKRVK
jgi:hypothetical protein